MKGPKIPKECPRTLFLPLLRTFYVPGRDVCEAGVTVPFYK